MRKKIIWSAVLTLSLAFGMMTGCGTDEKITEEEQTSSSQEADSQEADSQEADSQNADSQNADRQNVDSNEEECQEYAREIGFGNLGSATELEGTTVLVSVYASDSNQSWDWDKEADETTCQDMLTYTGIAVDWLTERTAEYKDDIKFIYDWSEDEDLYYEAEADGDFTSDGESDWMAWEYIDQNIDSQEILKKYDADNIVYLFFLNTPSSCDITSCTRNYYEGMEYPYEICYMYSHCCGIEEGPSGIAHEILHTFGAPDLYYADTDGLNYGITQEYVDELEEEHSNDIMFTTYDKDSNEQYYDHISNDLTELDAYYVGLTDDSKTVDEWGFMPSQHEK